MNLFSVAMLFKLLERITYNRPHESVIKNEVLYEKQFGFHAPHDAEQPILELVDSISNCFENAKFTQVFSQTLHKHLSKAFDTVDHTILLNKLNQYGIKIKYDDWFKC